MLRGTDHFNQDLAGGFRPIFQGPSWLHSAPVTHSIYEFGGGADAMLLAAGRGITLIEQEIDGAQHGRHPVRDGTVCRDFKHKPFFQPRLGPYEPLCNRRRLGKERTRYFLDTEATNTFQGEDLARIVFQPRIAAHTDQLQLFIADQHFGRCAVKRLHPVRHAWFEGTLHRVAAQPVDLGVRFLQATRQVDDAGVGQIGTRTLVEADHLVEGVRCDSADAARLFGERLQASPPGLSGDDERVDVHFCLGY